MNKLVDVIQTVIENSKHKEVYNMVKGVKDIKSAETISLYDVMEFVNNRKIKPYESFYIYGYLSSTGCLEVPETYFSETREYIEIRKIYDKGKLYNEATMAVNENKLPQCHPNYGKDIFIAFLYKDKNKRFKVIKNEKGEEILNQYQQFIPVILDEESYYKYVDTHVRLKSCVVPLEKIFTEKDLIIDDNKYSYLNECFYDIYQPYVTSFFLKCLDITSDITLNYDHDEKMQFIVEYEIIANESSRGLSEKVGKFTYKKEYGSLPKSFRFQDEHILFPSDNDVSICVKGKKIGFYKEIDMNDPKIYKKELKELEDYIRCFF